MAGLPEGVSIRPARNGELARICAVHDAAFGGPDEGRIVAAIHAAPEHIPELSLVAVEAPDAAIDANGAIDAVVGHLLIGRAWLEPEGGGPAEAILEFGPLAVRPDRQGRGIGQALTAAGLGVARTRGERLVVVLGHPWFYPRFGFRPARGLGIRPPADWPDDAWMALPLAGWPAGRSGLARYPSAFGPLDI